MLTHHRPLLLNWLRTGRCHSSGAVERLDLKAKLALVRVFGFRTDDACQLALYHTLGHLPQLPDAHNSCGCAFCLLLVSTTFCRCNGDNVRTGQMYSDDDLPAVTVSTVLGSTPSPRHARLARPRPPYCGGWPTRRWTRSLPWCGGLRKRRHPSRPASWPAARPTAACRLIRQWPTATCGPHCATAVCDSDWAGTEDPQLDSSS